MYLFLDRPLLLDIAHAEIHSFIAEECTTSVKFLVKGKFSYLLKHNLIRMFPRAKTMIENSYFNVKITRKILEDERDIYKVSTREIGKFYIPFMLAFFSLLNDNISSIIHCHNVFQRYPISFLKHSTDSFLVLLRT